MRLPRASRWLHMSLVELQALYSKRTRGVPATPGSPALFSNCIFGLRGVASSSQANTTHPTSTGRHWIDGRLRIDVTGNPDIRPARINDCSFEYEAPHLLCFDSKKGDLTKAR
jgi:hypothetical protein